MTMWDDKIFTENELSKFAKWFIVTVVIIPVFILAIYNICIGEVRNPYAFGITLLGFVLFTISKFSLFLKGVWISFGPKKMSECMANLYRVGYWLMIVGLISTFV